MQKWVDDNAFVMAFPFILFMYDRVFHAQLCVLLYVAIMLVFIYAPTEKVQGMCRRSYFHVSSDYHVFCFFSSMRSKYYVSLEEL